MLKVQRKPILAPDKKKPRVLSYQKFTSSRFLRKRMKNIDPYFIKRDRCCSFYDELEHLITLLLIYKAIGCQDRASCPICGASYWQRKGREAKSLFLIQREKRMFEGEDLSQWLLDFEFTLPMSLSRLIDDMNIEAKRDYVNKITRLSYKVLNQVFGSQIGGVTVLHFWQSRSPLFPHYHLHTILSPFSSGSGLLRDDPHLTKEELEKARKVWREGISQIFDIGFLQPFNIHYGYIKEGEKALAQFHHRFRYCFRHWTEDLAKWKGKLSKKSLEKAVNRARELQGITKIRWFGYLSPRKRKDGGFEAQELKSELLVCPECESLIKKESLITVLVAGEQGSKCECPHCEKIFEEGELKKASAWRKTGKTFVVKRYRKNGVIMAEWDNEKGKIKKGSEKLVPYENIDLWPNEAKEKRWTWKPPPGSEKPPPGRRG